MKNVWIYIILLIFPIPGFAEETAPADSSFVMKELDLTELKHIAVREVKNSHVTAFVQEISDGKIFYHVSVESEAEWAELWLDPYSGAIRKIYREEKAPPPEIITPTQADSKNSQPTTLISRATAERIALARIEAKAEVVNVSEVKDSDETYYEITIREKRMGAEKETIWVNKLTGEANWPADDPRRKTFESQQQRLSERLDARIKLSSADAAKKAVEAVSGRVVSSKLKKKSGDLYYYFQVLTDTEEIKTVRIHASKGSITVLR